VVPSINAQSDPGKEVVPTFVKGEDVLMEIALALYVIFATLALIWCSIPRTNPSVNYVRISRTMLNCLRKWSDDLVVV